MESSNLEKDQSNLHQLNIKSIIGFDGNTLDGFKVHPDGEHVVYTLGNYVSILHWKTKKQYFLMGHTKNISALDVSRSGKYIASGQINHIGFKAMVIIWDFEKRQKITKYESHKVRVECLRFSCDDRFLISIGGRDCGTLVIWNIAQNMCVAATEATFGIQGDALTILPTNKRGTCFLTAGDYNCTLWKIDVENRNAYRYNIKLLKLRRVIRCMVISERDETAYCGTSTGDIIKLRMNFHHDFEVIDSGKPPLMMGCFSKYSTAKKRNDRKGFADLWGNGVRALYLFPSGKLLVGAGNGDVDLCQEISLKTEKNKSVLKDLSTPSLKVIRSVNVRDSVTSITVLNESTILVGTAACELYAIDAATFALELMISCHKSTIFDIVFPHNYSEVFATSSADDIRIWSVSAAKELVRIQVPNFMCSSLVFTHDGKSLLTAWNDGIIRSFTPCTGRLIFAILNAHNKGVSALAVTNSGTKLVSGGCEGQVRVWKICKQKQILKETLKEHKAPITRIDINTANDEAVSSSTDGSCIVWDIVRMCRKQIIFSNTLFMSVKYHPSDVQILTVGSNRKIGYWEVFDGSLVREIEGSHSSALNALDIFPDGEYFVTGGGDQIIKLWKYREGQVVAYGIGHSGPITACRSSPDSKLIISTSAAGSIFIWDCPFEEVKKKEEAEKEPDLINEEIVISPPKENLIECCGTKCCPCGCGRPLPPGVCNCFQLNAC